MLSIDISILNEDTKKKTSHRGAEFTGAIETGTTKTTNVTESMLLLIEKCYKYESEQSSGSRNDNFRI